MLHTARWLDRLLVYCGRNATFIATLIMLLMSYNMGQRDDVAYPQVSWYALHKQLAETPPPPKMWAQTAHCRDIEERSSPLGVRN